MPSEDLEIRRRLDAALDQGPFSLALRLALKSSELSLDRIQHKLHERGTPLSKTALSYWQHGRTQPERRESLQALATLEDVVGVPKGALSNLLGPPRPRGRWLTQKPGGHRPDQVWSRPDGLSRVLDQLGVNQDALGWLTPVAVHFSVLVDERGGIRRAEHHRVLRAEHDGVDRQVVVYRTDKQGPAGSVEGVRGCRLGRRRSDLETGFDVYELLLDRPLRQGELTVLNHAMCHEPGLADAYVSQRVAQSVRTFSMQVQFASGRLPAQIRQSFRSSVSAEPETGADLWLGASNTAEVVAAEPDPGIYRIDWEWD